MCERHIGGKCQRCGWGLPLMYNTKRKATNDLILYNHNNNNNKRIKKSPTQSLNTSLINPISHNNKASNNYQSNLSKSIFFFS